MPTQKKMDKKIILVNPKTFKSPLKKLDSEEVPLNVEAKFKNGAIKALLKLMIQNTNLSK